MISFTEEEIKYENVTKTCYTLIYELNKKIKQIAKKIDFKFDSNNEFQGLEFFNVSESNLEKIVKKTEIIDYIQKTFEVMGIVR